MLVNCLIAGLLATEIIERRAESENRAVKGREKAKVKKQQQLIALFCQRLFRHANYGKQLDFATNNDIAANASAVVRREERCPLSPKSHPFSAIRRQTHKSVAEI